MVMEIFNFVSAQIENKKCDYSVYECPICGVENKMNSSECKCCHNSLLEFETIQYSHYNLYMEAIMCIKKNDNYSALEKITVFLEFYPKDLEANHLYLYILYKLNDPRFQSKVEDYIRRESDRWAVKLQESPEQILIKDFSEKQLFIGVNTKAQLKNVLAVKFSENCKNAKNLIDVINSAYEMYFKIKNGNTAWHNNKYKQQYIWFYEKIFTKYLLNNDISVIDYFEENFEDLTIENQKYFGNVEKVENKRKPNGLIINVLKPEIRYKSLFLQKADIVVNVLKNNCMMGRNKK